MEDTLTVANGFIGTYPSAFYVVERARLAAFVAHVDGLRGEADYAALQVGYGVRRTDPDFWPTSDRLVERYRQMLPVEAGFDLGRYENRWALRNASWLSQGVTWSADHRSRAPPAQIPGASTSAPPVSRQVLYTRSALAERCLRHRGQGWNRTSSSSDSIKIVRHIKHSAR